ncbi:dephospho-CoA kinase [Filimonas lacunae]|uniref:Dephospho-CoA kinase n=1 Tax=Filimonas lacunae TaxID=477680 RepID=A0A173MJ61_9BACT|nr:dephospho-CoA kinase [Filimonas lacunae]BAV07654.1 dephospho-CoA kinase [Filimonas lacunae]SIT03055.1 dephospho-CoA kinase [Filimonas lacunae]
MLLKVGLTGGIGSGKSTVAKVFKVLGIPIFDADVVAKNIMATDTALQQAIMQTFGADIFENGELNRKKLAGIVFNDAFRLEQLNALVHPAAIKAADYWMQQQLTRYAIKEAALLFEAGSASDLDYVVGVYAPKALRVQRVMQRDSTTREEVLARMSRQIDEEIKMRLCDFVVVNNDQELLIPQVLKIHGMLMEKAAVKDATVV